MKKRGRTAERKLWVAVRVERGFVSDAKVFESIDVARRVERRWRARSNPDYDETAVVESKFVRLRQRC